MIRGEFLGHLSNCSFLNNDLIIITDNKETIIIPATDNPTSRQLGLQISVALFELCLQLLRLDTTRMFRSAQRPEFGVIGDASHW
jgi:hypothetical protein